MRRALARWRAREAEERAALVEALAMLALASALVRFAPFRRIAALASRPTTRTPSEESERTVARTAWAIRAAARRVPFRAMCIEQGLAAQLMLRRRGAASTLHYGVSRDPARGVAAHVWVTLAGRPVVGCEEATAFREVARFPPQA
jgi:hypothetical protein